MHDVMTLKLAIFFNVMMCDQNFRVLKSNYRHLSTKPVFGHLSTNIVILGFIKGGGGGQYIGFYRPPPPKVNMNTHPCLVGDTVVCLMLARGRGGAASPWDSLTTESVVFYLASCC
jgi:hypothetical protein